MIIETKTYWSDAGHPSKDDINAAIIIANENNIRIDLRWFGADNRYYGGYHSVFINPGDTYEVVDSILPKMYGV